MGNNTAYFFFFLALFSLISLDILRLRHLFVCLFERDIQRGREQVSQCVKKNHMFPKHFEGRKEKKLGNTLVYEKFIIYMKLTF